MTSVFLSPIETGACLEQRGALPECCDSGYIFRAEGNHTHSTCISQIFRGYRAAFRTADVQIKRARFPSDSLWFSIRNICDLVLPHVVCDIMPILENGAWALKLVLLRFLGTSVLSSEPATCIFKLLAKPLWSRMHHCLRDLHNAQR